MRDRHYLTLLAPVLFPAVDEGPADLRGLLPEQTSLRELVETVLRLCLLPGRPLSFPHGNTFLFTWLTRKNSLIKLFFVL